MSPVHPSAAVGFDRAAVAYERGRPGYPPAAIELLAGRLELGPGSRIVDLAAGTGKLTRALTGLGAQITAVEPVAGMREQLQAVVPGVTVLDGTAEAIPLRDGGVDAVLVAQAFHWFDVEAAAAEIARVLTPTGGLGVVRNAWDRSVGWVDAMQARIGEVRGNEPSQDNSRWQPRLEATGRFAALHEEIVDHVVRSDRETLLDRVSSVSFVATLPDGERVALLADIAAILDRHGVGARDVQIVMPYRTHVVWARRWP